MYTFDLLSKYLGENISHADYRLNEYELNGSVVKITYSYKYKWSDEERYNSYSSYWSYDNKMEVELLDYITWVFNLLVQIEK